MMERVVARLHIPPCPNDQISGQDMTNIIYSFWQEFKHWQNMTGSYAVCQGQFLTPDALERRSHIWHETYSSLYTKVLGFVVCRVTSKRLRSLYTKVLGSVVCRVTSKRLRIGSGECAWSDVKQIKDGRGPTLVVTFKRRGQFCLPQPI